jgi:hypothetical protein
MGWHYLCLELWNSDWSLLRRRRLDHYFHSLGKMVCVKSSRTITTIQYALTGVSLHILILFRYGFLYWNLLPTDLLPGK